LICVQSSLIPDGSGELITRKSPATWQRRAFAFADAGVSKTLDSGQVYSPAEKLQVFEGRFLQRYSKRAFHAIKNGVML
jgi:hypothetical protein